MECKHRYWKVKAILVEQASTHKRGSKKSSAHDDRRFGPIGFLFESITCETSRESRGIRYEDIDYCIDRAEVLHLLGVVFREENGNIKEEAKESWESEEEGRYDPPASGILTPNYTQWLDQFLDNIQTYGALLDSVGVLIINLVALNLSWLFFLLLKSSTLWLID